MNSKNTRIKLQIFGENIYLEIKTTWGFKWIEELEQTNSLSTCIKLFSFFSTICIFCLAFHWKFKQHYLTYKKSPKYRSNDLYGWSLHFMEKGLLVFYADDEMKNIPNLYFYVCYLHLNFLLASFGWCFEPLFYQFAYNQDQIRIRKERITNQLVTYPNIHSKEGKIDIEIWFSDFNLNSVENRYWGHCRCFLKCQLSHKITWSSDRESIWSHHLNRNWNRNPKIFVYIFRTY